MNKIDRVISAEAESLILGFEEFVAYTYDDRDGHNPRYRLMPNQPCQGVPTIGFGHCGPEAYPGNHIDEAEAKDLFIKDISVCENYVQQWCPGLSDNQFGACVSLAYNIGVTAFHQSSLLRLLVARDYQGAANEFPKWDKQDGQVLPGLLRRRLAEQQLFTRTDAQVPA